MSQPTPVSPAVEIVQTAQAFRMTAVLVAGILTGLFGSPALTAGLCECPIETPAPAPATAPIALDAVSNVEVSPTNDPVEPEEIGSPE